MLISRSIREKNAPLSDFVTGTVVVFVDVRSTKICYSRTTLVLLFKLKQSLGQR